MEIELPGATSLAAFYAADESEMEFTDELKHILEVIAWTGNYWHEWALLKCLLSFRLKQVLTQHYDTHSASGGQQILVSGEAFNDFQRRLLESLDSFSDGPPFTLQRLCELLLNPRLTYPNVDKASLAFEKLLLVTSTIPACNDPYPSTNGRQGWNQAQETRLGSDMAGANGPASGTDEEMPDVGMAEDKQIDSDKLPGEEALRSSENRLVVSEENCVSSQPVTDQENQLSNDSSLIDDDLVDISLDDQSPVAKT